MHLVIWMTLKMLEENGLLNFESILEKNRLYFLIGVEIWGEDEGLWM